MEGKTYRFFRDEPLYSFGYGLSYTTFTYESLKMPGSVPCGIPADISFRVTNTGERDGDEVVQVYVSLHDASNPRPIKSLQGFERIHLKAGESRVVDFTIVFEQMGLPDDNQVWVVARPLSWRWAASDIPSVWKAIPCLFPTNNMSRDVLITLLLIISNAKKENLNEEETPETENSENMPDSNDEEEADKQEVQEKDLQKDQQGTFRSRPTAMPTISSRMMSLKMRKSEDIPVLTDISVTWEPDENREDESGFYYYLPVLPREYILAAGVELPEIEVSMDGGIALLASTDTYDIANGGININSNTLEQYNDATITGSSTTNVILVNGVEATITISNLDIQIPLVKNDETASTRHRRSDW